MAPKRSNINDTKELLKGLLNGVYEQINILQDFIDKWKNEALKDGEDLLAEQNKTKFFKRFPTVSRQLGEALSHLSLITDAINSSEDDAAISSDDEDEGGDACSEISGFTVTSQSTITDKEIHENEGDIAIESFQVEERRTNEAIQLEERPVVKGKVPTIEKPVSLAGHDNSLQGERIDSLPYHAPKSELENIDNLMPPIIKAKKTPPPRQVKRISPASSVSPLLPKVLTKNVKVPKEKVDFDVSQTVIVSEMDHPWSFYLQFDTTAYNTLMEELCMHFAKEASRGYKGGICNIPDEGTYCCAKLPSDQIWYRAQILNVRTVDITECADDTNESVSGYLDDPVLSRIIVNVFMIDVGTVVDVTLRNIRPLEAQFAKLQPQAIHCMMGGIAPVDYDANIGNTSWSEASVSWFKCTIKSEHLFTAVFHKPSRDSDCIPVDLYSGDYSCSSNALLPPIETNIAFMMLLVSLGSPYPEKFSHIIEHYHEIEDTRYKAADHIIDDEEAADISIEIEKNVQAINLDSKPNNISSEAIREIDSSHSREMEASNVTNESIQVATENLPSPSSDVAGSGSSLNNAKLNATFENCFVEKKFIVGAEGFCPVLVSVVKDPGLFYVHLITPDVRMLDEMMEELNECYSNNEFSVPENRLNIDNAVVVKYSEDGYWYRGVIKHLRIPNADETSQREQPQSNANQFEYEVLHVDFGSSEWVKHENVRPVVEKFFQLPMETLPCCLADIEPMEISRDISSASSSGGTNKRPRSLSTEMKTNVKEPRSNKTQRKITEVAAGDEDYSDVFLDKDRSLNHLKEVKWSEAAVERLKELTLDGKQRMASPKEKGISERLPDEPTPIYLYNTNEKVAVFINKVLVNEALAVSNVLPKDTEEASHREHRKVTILQSELEKIASKITGKQDFSDKLPSPLSPMASVMDSWDPMKQAFLSNRNAYSINTDDPEVAISGYADPLGNVCSYFFTPSGCYRGSSCPFKHPMPGDNGYTKVGTFGFVDVTEQFPDLPEVGSFALIQITSLITPVHLFVRFPYGTTHFDDILRASSFTQEYDDRDELMDRQEKLNEKFATMPFRRSDEKSWQEGDLIAAKFAEDGQWYRARVYHVLEDGKYQVCYIDFGNIAVVKAKDVRGLTSDFMDLSPQAVETFLANVEFAPRVMEDRNLQKEATEFFEKVVGDGLLTARIMSKSSNGTISVELYDRKTTNSINSHLLTRNYFVRSRKEITRPWSMFDAMAVNTDIKHFTPG